MKLIILSILLSSYTFAVDTKSVLNQLMNIHGSDWNAIIQSNSDKAEIKSTLSDIINKKIDPTDFDFRQDLVPDIIANAVGEYGHFVEVTQDGKMTESDSNIFKSIGEQANKDPTGSLALSYYYGLQNAATPDSLTTLADSLDNTFDDPSTSYTIARNIGVLLEGSGNLPLDPRLDNSHIKAYKPRLSSAYYNKKGQWRESVLYSAKKLKESYQNIKDVSKDESFLKAYKDIGQKVFDLRKYARNTTSNDNEQTGVVAKVEETTPPSNNKEVKQRTIASDIEKEDKREIDSIEEKDSYPITYYFFIGIFFLLIFILFKQVRS